ncbi:MAG TPA: hypothetical protein VMS00_03430, partial [Acidimicrobiales bacterium]|nr:hypothetical protein [Acidimicrobiales bacterium]
AFDTPLSPPPLDDGPGPATGLSGDYPDGTSTRRAGPVCRTQHADERSDYAVERSDRWGTMVGTRR